MTYSETLSGVMDYQRDSHRSFSPTGGGFLSCRKESLLSLQTNKWHSWIIFKHFGDTWNKDDTFVWQLLVWLMEVENRRVHDGGSYDFSLPAPQFDVYRCSNRV